MRATVLLLVVALSACSAGSSAILETLPYAYGRKSGVDSVRLNPNFRYLRLTVGGRVVLLALGNVDSHPLGPIEVWYSAEREVLRLQNGRLVGAVGLTTEWRDVVLPALPSWSAAASADSGVRWTRTRDVMPGYRFGVKDALMLRVVEEPKRSELKGMDAERLKWFEERVEPGMAVAGASAAEAVDGRANTAELAAGRANAAEAVAGRANTAELAAGRANTAELAAGFFGVFGSSAAADPPLPPARYAVDLRGGLEIVVYGEQCLTKDLCFTWQRWPVPGAGEQK